MEVDSNLDSDSVSVSVLVPEDGRTRIFKWPFPWKGSDVDVGCDVGGEGPDD